MKHGTPLRRRKPMSQRSDSAYRRRERDVAYMVWVKRQPCCAAALGGCQGAVEADHAGTRAMGRKASDDTCIPLCQHHHTQRHAFHGPFKAWDRETMRSWLDYQIGHHQGLFTLRRNA